MYNSNKVALTYSLLKRPWSSFIVKPLTTHLWCHSLWCVRVRQPSGCSSCSRAVIQQSESAVTHAACCCCCCHSASMTWRHSLTPQLVSALDRACVAWQTRRQSTTTSECVRRRVIQPASERGAWWVGSSATIHCTFIHTPATAALLPSILPMHCNCWKLQEHSFPTCLHRRIIVILSLCFRYAVVAASATLWPINISQ